MYKIYIYRNSINGKVYIGSTKNSIARRYNSGYSYKGSFKEALETYGRDKFTVDILMECKTKREAETKEKEFIHIYDSTNPNKGYNDNDHTKRITKVKCVENDMIFDSFAEAEYYCCGGHNLYKVVDNPNRTYHGYHWVSVDEEE